MVFQFSSVRPLESFIADDMTEVLPEFGQVILNLTIMLIESIKH